MAKEPCPTPTPCGLNGCELTASVTALANLFAQKFDVQTLGLFALLFTQLGDTLAALAFMQETCKSGRQAP